MANRSAMNRPLRLLNLIRTLDPEAGGPVEGLRQSVAATRALGHEEEVLTLDDASQPWVRGFAAPTHAMGPARGNFGYTPRLLPWLRKHAGRYDALVVHGLWQYHGMVARRALLGGAVPYFVYPHGMLDPWFKRAYPSKHAKKWLYWMAAERCVLRDAAAVLFTTREESRLAPQTFPLLQARHEVLGYGLALDQAARQAHATDFLQRFANLKGRRLLLFLGRLHPKKGCDLLTCVDSSAGTPMASASAAATPKFSWCEGSTKASAARSAPHFSAPWSMPVKVTRSAKPWRCTIDCRGASRSAGAGPAITRCSRGSC